MEVATSHVPLDYDGPELALRLALDGLETGRYVLVDAEGTLAVVGDGIDGLLGGPAPGSGAPATLVLGDVGDPLPVGVARCGERAVALEATFAPVEPAEAESVRAELDRLAATLGAPAERPAWRAVLARVAGRPVMPDATGDHDGTLVVLRRADPLDPLEVAIPAGAPPEAVALVPVLEELRALRTEVSELREQVLQPHERAALDAEVRLARHDAEAAQAEAARLRDEVAALRDDLTRQADELGEAVRAAVLLGEDARRDALAARSDADAARAEAATAREHDDGPRVRPERVAEIWRQMLATNDAAAQQARPAQARAAAAARLERPIEPGFDDVAAPMAQVGLDGRFLRLNPAFSALVGYGERDFGKATWPSLLDRADYEVQCRRRDELLAGTAERVPLDASYLGGQGLLVVVRGHVEVVRDAGGAPLYLLLVGEDRHTL